MEITRKIDWLQYTHHHIDNWTLRLPYANFDEITGKELRPLPRYQKAYELFGGGRVDVSEDEHQGVQVTLGGGACTEWNVNGVSYQQMISQAVDFGKVVRVDFATDVREDGSTDFCLWELVKQAVETKSYKSKASPGIQIIDKTKGGYSQYFGSYKSDRFTRVYDKAVESGMLKLAMEKAGILPVWTRVEVVTKRDFAHNLASDMKYKGWQQAGASYTKSLLSFPGIEQWEGVISGEDVEITKNPRKEPKFWQWLDNQVLPAMEKKMWDYDDNIRLIQWLSERLNDAHRIQYTKRKK